MTKEERLSYYDKSREKWGIQAQIDHLIEEMAELTVALNKYKRAEFYNENIDKEKAIENIHEEFSGVSMLLEHLINYFGEEDYEKSYTLQFEKFKRHINKQKTSK